MGLDLWLQERKQFTDLSVSKYLASESLCQQKPKRFGSGLVEIHNTAPAVHPAGIFFSAT